METCETVTLCRRTALRLFGTHVAWCVVEKETACDVPPSKQFGPLEKSGSESLLIWDETMKSTVMHDLSEISMNEHFRAAGTGC